MRTRKEIEARIKEMEQEIEHLHNEGRPHNLNSIVERRRIINVLRWVLND